MSGARGQRVVRVFYRDAVTGTAIPSNAPESLLAERLVPLAERLLSAPDSFIGVIDRRDTVLQAYVADAADSVTLELLFAETPGCLRLTLPRGAAMDLLRRLPESFDQDLLQGAENID